MKNVVILIAFLFPTKLMGQVAPGYHLVREIQIDETTVADFCADGVFSSNIEFKLNINLDDKLPVNTVFIADLNSIGGHKRYYVVIESQDSPIGNPHEIITDFANTCEIVNFCGGNLKTYKRHRIYYLGTSASVLETLYCQYLQNLPSGNGIKVNIFRNAPLTMKKVYYFAAGSGVPEGYYYVAYSGNTRDPDEDSNIHDYMLINRVDSPDSDGDGYPNSCDNCPTQAGIIENDGCPGSPAELALDPEFTSVYSNCNNCPPYLSSLGTGRHEIARNGGMMSIGALIRNSGQQSSGNYNIGVFLSTNNILNPTDIRFNSSTVSASSVNGNGQSLPPDIVVYGSDFATSISYGYYYILVVLDVDNNVVESNENNNVTAIPIRYKPNLF